MIDRSRWIVGLALLALVSAHTAAQPATPKRKLVVWGVSLGADAKGQDAVNREFERLHPDVELKVLGMGAGGMNPQKLLTSIVGNVAPDVIYQDRFTVSDWASRGAFRPLDDLLQRDIKSDPLCPRPEQYYPATWAEATYNKQIYGIPSGADNRVMYWNRSIFREKSQQLIAAGLDPNRPPKNWSELLAYSEILTDKNPDGTLKRAGFMPNFGNSWLYMYAFQNEGSFMSADGRKCTLYSPETEEALAFMVKGYDVLGGYERAKAFESGFLGNENDAFIIGKVAMKIDGDWILNGLSRYAPQLDFGVAPPPPPDDRLEGKGRFAGSTPYVTWLGGFCYSIPKGARNVQDAWEFIKFASSTRGRMIEFAAQRDWERRRGKVFIPRQIASQEANQEAFRRFKPADKNFGDALKMHVEMANYGRVRPATFVAQKLWNEHVRAFEAAAYHRATPKQALLASQAQVQLDLDAFFNKERYAVVDLGIPLKIGLGLAVVTLAVLVAIFPWKRLGRLGRLEALWAYIFLLPWFIGFLVFTLGPMLASLFFSFTQYDVLNDARWVGLKNYQTMFGADLPMVKKAFGNAAYLAAVGVPLGLMTGLAVAVLLNTAAKGMRFYRTIFYMPAIVPGVASAVLWTWVLTPDANKGLINSGWQSTLTPWLGIAPPAWLNSADWSKNALVFMGLWGAGSGMVLWLAGLKGVPGTLYEASSLDGATPWQQFWSVTFPQLSPIVFFNTVMGFIGAVQEFDRMYIMKPPSDGSVGPDDTLMTPVFHLFTKGFRDFQMGYASSLAWLIFGIILILTFIQFRLAPRWVHYEANK